MILNAFRPTGRVAGVQVVEKADDGYMWYATFQHEIRELQRYIHDNKAKIEALEAKAIVVR